MLSVDHPAGDHVGDQDEQDSYAPALLSIVFHFVKSDAAEGAEEDDHPKIDARFPKVPTSLDLAAVSSLRLCDNTVTVTKADPCLKRLPSGSCGVLFHRTA